MNRQIKFRAWLPNCKVMLHDVTLYPSSTIGYDYDAFALVLKSTGLEIDEDKIRTCPSSDGKIGGDIVDHFLVGFDWIWYEGAVLMQFTGLMDKNGVEIFEGDLLSHKFYDRPVVVTWNNRTGGFISEDVSFYDEATAHMEVVGNLYSNPELVKQ